VKLFLSEPLVLTQDVTINSLASLAETRDNETGGHIRRTQHYGRAGSSFLVFAREIAFTHQEKWDGSGYPQGIAGEEIPIPGRLMAVADVYDALISKRVYKTPFTHSKAFSIIEEGRGSHFDPDITDAFLEIQEKFRDIALKFADHDEERELLRK
jgi:putative two-component system response regulator